MQALRLGMLAYLRIKSRNMQFGGGRSSITTSYDGFRATHSHHGSVPGVFIWRVLKSSSNLSLYGICDSTMRLRVLLELQDSSCGRTETLDCETQLYSILYPLSPKAILSYQIYIQGGESPMNSDTRSVSMSLMNLLNYSNGFGSMEGSVRRPVNRPVEMGDTSPPSICLLSCFTNMC